MTASTTSDWQPWQLALTEGEVRWLARCTLGWWPQSEVDFGSAAPREWWQQLEEPGPMREELLLQLHDTQPETPPASFGVDWRDLERRLVTLTEDQADVLVAALQTANAAGRTLESFRAAGLL